MRHMIRVAILLVLFAPVAALASVNHGDFLGTTVDFLQVTETTQTAGDPEPLWGAPVLAGTGDQLAFFPPSYTSSCAAGSSDITGSLLTTEIVAQPGTSLDRIAFQENGDVVLTAFPPFGNPATNATVALSGFITVTEDGGGPIAPVVIPFVGTFLPSANFALPGNFGSGTWVGNIDVDIAGVVPGATKATLSLDNNLATNCAPGSSSGLVQKKVVSGPTVAIIVNPVACELDLEKTCCVTQPALPDLDICEGDATSIVFEYTGDKCHASNNDQGHSFHCWGRRKVGEPADITVLSSGVTATPDTGVNIGDTVEFTHSSGTLPERIKLKITGPWGRRQYLEINTSCEKALRCDDQFGALKLVELDSTLGGFVDCSAPPPEAACAGTGGDPAGTPCDAKLVDMILEYNGKDCQEPLGNTQNGSASCAGDATGATNVGIIDGAQQSWKQMISPSSMINDGDRIRVTARYNGGLAPNQRLRVVDGNGVQQTVEFHVSCSQPLALGDEFGSFKLVEWTTKSGTHLELGTLGNPQLEACEVPLAPPGPHCTSELQDLTLVYIGDLLGEGCSVSNTQGSYAHCSGVDDPGDPLTGLVVTTNGVSADPTDTIEFGDLVTFTADSGGDLPWLLNFDATGAGGSQWIQIKTSCQKPLSLGDRFGGFVVFGMDRKDEGAITLGGNVQYQYKVTNPSGSLTIDNVSIDDDQLDNIVSGLSLAPGEMQTFTKSATLFGTTQNIAMATGDVNGDICDEGADSVTVTVTAPPQSSFTCGEPITEISMVWDGTQTVDIVAWDGGVGTTNVGNFDNVAPGDVVTVSISGYYYPVWEIFDETGVTKLGESSFDLWCNDKSMNGLEDCGKRNGNLKIDDPGLINDWLLEGMIDANETLACTPDALPPAEDCGFGPELILVMPGLMWFHRRRMRKQS